MEIVVDDLGMGPVPSKGEASSPEELKLNTYFISFIPLLLLSFLCRLFFLHLAKKASEKRELERDLMLYVHTFNKHKATHNRSIIESIVSSLSPQPLIKPSRMKQVSNAFFITVVMVACDTKIPVRAHELAGLRGFLNVNACPAGCVPNYNHCADCPDKPNCVNFNRISEARTANIMGMYCCNQTAFEEFRNSTRESGANFTVDNLTPFCHIPYGLENEY
jgi:hypothetical protein